MPRFFLSKYLPDFSMWNLGSWNLFSCFSDSSVHCSASTVKQKIVMKVQFISEKRKTEAFKVAAGFRGVSNVSVEADKGQIVVTGVGVDSVCLVKSLRKKLRRCYVEIESVEEVKDKPKEEKKPEVESIPIQWVSSYVHYPMPYDVYRW